MLIRTALAATTLAALAAPALAQPLTSAFTYQGELADNGTPVGGSFDLEFRLFDSPGGVTQVGPTLCSDNLAVNGGRFTVQLDFGAQFSAQSRYLEVRVRADSGLSCGNSTGYTTLAPRQLLSAAPVSSFALLSATATSAATATNSTQLNGQPATFYTNAGNMTAGTLANSRTSGTTINAPNTLILRNASGGFDAGPISATSLSGAGSAITALNASNISSGVLAITRGGTGLADQLPASAGQFLRSPAAGSWSIANLSASDLPAHAGDLAGSFSASIVDGLQGRPLSATAPATNEVLTWTGSLWAPASIPAPPAPTLAGDITGPVGATSVSRLQGRALSAATPSANQVLTYTGSQWVPQTLPSYTAGAGLSLSGATFSVPANGITGAMLATDPASLTKVSGSMMAVSGSNIGINIGAPETDLHIRSPAPTLTVEGNINAANAATLLLLEDLGSSTDTGGRITYDGAADDLLIGTVVSDAVTTAITIPRGSPNVNFLGTITVPTTTRTLSISGAGFTTNEFAQISPNGSMFPRVNENGASGTVAHAMASINLPEGATITQFKVFALGGGPVPVTATLRRTPLSTQTTTVMATLTINGAGSPYTTTAITSPIIDNDANAYFAHFTWTNNGGHTFDINGLQITYTITSPLP